MATKLTISEKLAWNGTKDSQQRAYVGYGSGPYSSNWGTRYKIKTGSDAISKLTVRSYFYQTNSTELKNYPVRVGISTSSSAFLDANGKSGYVGTLGYDTSTSGYNVSAIIDLNDAPLEANTTYYVFFYPAFKTEFKHMCYNSSVTHKAAIWAEEYVPKVSTITASDANIGATSILVINRKSSSYTHTIQYQFGTESAYIDAAGNVSATAVKLTASNIGFMLPVSWYSQIPNTKTGITD